MGAAEQCVLLQSRQNGSSSVIQTAQAAQQLVSAVCRAALKVSIMAQTKTLSNGPHLHQALPLFQLPTCGIHDVSRVKRGDMVSQAVQWASV